MNSTLRLVSRHDSGRVLKGRGFGCATMRPQKRTRALQAAEKLKTEGVGGFNPRRKPTKSQVALATEGQFSSIPAKFPSFSTTCLAPAELLVWSPSIRRIAQRTSEAPRWKN